MRVAFYKYHRPGWQGFFDLVIRCVSGGPYSHCELIFSDGKAFSSSIQDGGCRFKLIPFDPVRWDFIEIPLVGTDEWQVRSFCITQIGMGYDFQGMFRFIAPCLGESDKRWFCSEICCAALQHAGLLPGIKGWSVSPSRLYELLATDRT